jgi:hypothetical protein
MYLFSSVLDPNPYPDPLDPHVLGFPDPDLDPLVRGMAPDPSINLLAVGNGVPM